MPNPQLKLFTDHNVLQKIEPTLLYEFLGHFKDILGEKFAGLLNRGSADFLPSFQAFLQAPQAGPVLPELAAIEFLAAPENRNRLDFAILNAPISPAADLSAPPLQRALYLWLLKPFELPCPPGVSRYAESRNSPSAPGTPQNSELPVPHSALETLPIPHSALETLYTEPKLRGVSNEHMQYITEKLRLM